jgi:twinkle protein
MSAEAEKFRHGIPGYFALADLPQQTPIAERAISTGWPELDRVFKLYSGQTVMVTGRIGNGKSTFLFNLIANVARLHGIKSFVYVPENEGGAYNKFKRLFADDASAFEHFIGEQCFLQSCRAEFYGDDRITLQWMLDMAARAIERDHIELLLIDPWNYLERIKPREQLMTEYINDCLHDFAQFARYFQITAIMVAHPTKNVAHDIVGLYDIEGSAAFANKSDNGLSIGRQADGTVRVHSVKVRECPDAGDLGCCNFWIDKETGKFTPLVGAASGYDGQPKNPRSTYGDYR